MDKGLIILVGDDRARVLCGDRGKVRVSWVGLTTGWVGKRLEVVVYLGLTAGWVGKRLEVAVYLGLTTGRMGERLEEAPAFAAAAPSRARIRHPLTGCPLIFAALYVPGVIPKNSYANRLLEKCRSSDGSVTEVRTTGLLQ